MIKSLCLELFNLNEYIIQEGDTHAICLRPLSRQLKRVSKVRFPELDQGYGT